MLSKIPFYFLLPLMFSFICLSVINFTLSMNEVHSSSDPIYDLSNLILSQYYPEMFLWADKLLIIPIITFLSFLFLGKNKNGCLTYVYSSLLRSLCLLLTSLPLRPHHHHRIKNKSSSILDIIIAGILGETSGDYFFSGHTMMYMSFALLLYTSYPNTKVLLFGYIYVIVGVFLIFISGEHYSIDILFGLFVPYAFSKILKTV
jgi:hypothetical protein